MMIRVAGALTAAIVMAGCSTRTDTEAPLVFSPAVSDVVDSVAPNVTLSAKVSLNYPESGPQPGVDSLRDWLGGVMNVGAGETPRSGGQMVEEVISRARENVRDDVASMDEIDGFRLAYEYIWDADTVMTTPKVVTYGVNCYNYAGGAHGITVYSAATFDMADGHALGWEMFRTEMLEELNSLVVDSVVAQSFDGDWGSFADNLILGNDAEVPLPVSAPIFGPNGIVFGYQQYEIVNYASGMPGCVISYEQIRRFMTPEAQELIP